MLSNKSCLFRLATATVLALVIVFITTCCFLAIFFLEIKRDNNLDKNKVQIYPKKEARYPKNIDTFYASTGYFDYSRLPLIKPYELVAFDRNFNKPFLVNTSISKNDLKRQVCTLNSFNITGTYLVANIKVEGNSKLEKCYCILDLKNKTYSDFDIFIDYDCRTDLKGKNYQGYIIAFYYGKKFEIENFTSLEQFIKRAIELGFSKKKLVDRGSKSICIIIPMQFKGCIFFNQNELSTGLKARKLINNINLHPPEFFFRKFFQNKRCPWFPLPGKKVKDSGQKK